MKKKKQITDILFFAAAAVLVLVFLYSGLRIAESTVLRQQVSQAAPVKSKTIVRDDVSYFPRQDITVVMVLGIDQYGKVADSETYNNHGAADMVVLLVFDETNQVCNVLHLNRDTMLEMPVLGLGGRKAGTRFGQLALSHTYGSGLADSCENARQTVSDFLYGIRIDYYMAMRMDAISLINDAVGGVTVDVTEDFSQIDPSIGMGRVTLMGNQAISFVRSRQGVGDQLNLSRIRRQQAYIDGFTEAFRARREEEPEFILSAYNSVAEYIVTDCSANAISGMVDRFGGFRIGEVVTPEGENRVGEEYMEFYADEDALDALILRLFYAPKK